MSFKHNSDSHSFVNAIRVIVQLLKLQERKKKCEIESFYGLEFWPYDPKVSSVINSFPVESTTPPPKYTPLAFQSFEEDKKDNIECSKEKCNFISPEHSTSIKMFLSNSLHSVKPQYHVLNPTYQSSPDTNKKKLTKKKNKTNLRVIDISQPINMTHVAGLKKGTPSSETCDVEHAIKEFMKVAGLNEDLIHLPNVRKKLEEICLKNNLVSTFQKYRVISNCFDESIRIKRRKPSLNNSEELDSVASSNEKPDSNTKECPKRTILHQEGKYSNQKEVSIRASQMLHKGATLEELVINNANLSNTTLTESDTSTLTEIYSFETSRDNDQLSVVDLEYDKELNQRNSEEEMWSTSALLRSILTVKLKPIANSTVKTSLAEDLTKDMEDKIRETIIKMRPFIRPMSICSDNDEETNIET